MTAPLKSPPPPDPSQDVLLLDFDGTLVPLAERPEGVVVTGELITRLNRLSDLFEGRLALVSGRAIEVLDDFGFAGLAIAGSHGAEWRLPDGTRDGLARPDALDDAKAAFIDFARGKDGVLFEDKPLGAALHFRLAPAFADASIELAREMAHGLHLQHGHEMIEVRVGGVNKGTAITELMNHAPFAGFRPVFLGDDVTDEDGFARVEEHGGHGILVGQLRETRASFHLSDPNAVNAWLAHALELAG
ncbi:trehalose-phosphatase [Croceicoccus sediminis]|uniref:trehalose-phosphatase n=1 Tax=Croceicoccus sediminis TaxID=2571150 RepID=UPI001F0E55D4|nr:trehalose-phosphatase [Croceicoccus sediminis]